MKKKKLFLFMALTSTIAGLTSCNVSNDNNSTNIVEQTTTTTTTTVVDDGSLSNEEVNNLINEFKKKDYNYASVIVEVDGEKNTYEYTLHLDSWMLYGVRDCNYVPLDSICDITKLKDLNGTFKIYPNSSDTYLAKFIKDGISYECVFSKDGYIATATLENVSSDVYNQKLKVEISFDSIDLYHEEDFNSYLNNVKRLDYNKCHVKYRDGKTEDVYLKPIWTKDGSVYDYSKYFFILDVKGINDMKAISMYNSYTITLENEDFKEVLTYDEYGYLTDYISYENDNEKDVIEFDFSYQKLESTKVDYQKLLKEVENREVKYAFNLSSNANGKIETINNFICYNFIDEQYILDSEESIEYNPLDLVYMVFGNESSGAYFTLEKDENGRYVLSAIDTNEFGPNTLLICHFDENNYVTKILIKTTDNGVDYNDNVIEFDITPVDYIIQQSIYELYIDGISDNYYNVATITSNNGEVIELRKDIIWEKKFDGFDISYFALNNVINKESYNDKDLTFTYDGYFTVKHKIDSSSYELLRYDNEGILVSYQLYVSDELKSEYTIEFSGVQNAQIRYDIDAIKAEILNNRKTNYYAATEVNTNLESNIVKNVNYTYDYNSNKWVLSNSTIVDGNPFIMEEFLDLIDEFYSYEITKDANGYYKIVGYIQINNLFCKRVLEFNEDYYLVHSTSIIGDRNGNLVSNNSSLFEYEKRLLTKEEFEKYYGSIERKYYDTCVYTIKNLNTGVDSTFTNTRTRAWACENYCDFDVKHYYLPDMTDSSIIESPIASIYYDGLIVIEVAYPNQDVVTYKYSISNPGYLYHFSNSTYDVDLKYSLSFDSKTLYSLSDVSAEISNERKAEEVAVSIEFSDKNDDVKTIYYEYDSSKSEWINEKSFIVNLNNMISLESVLAYIDTNNDSNTYSYITKENGLYVVTIVTDGLNNSYCKLQYNSNYYLVHAIIDFTDGNDLYYYEATSNYCNKKADKESLESFIDNMKLLDYDKLVVTDEDNEYEFFKYLVWDIDSKYTFADPTIFTLKGFYSPSMFDDDKYYVSVNNDNCYCIRLVDNGIEKEYTFDNKGYIKSFSISDYSIPEIIVYEFNFSKYSPEVTSSYIDTLINNAKEQHKNEIYAKANITERSYLNNTVDNYTISYNSDLGAWEYPIHLEDYLEQLRDGIVRISEYDNYYSILMKISDTSYAEIIANKNYYITGIYFYSLDEYQSNLTVESSVSFEYEIGKSNPTVGQTYVASYFYNEVISKPITKFSHVVMSANEGTNQASFDGFGFNGVWIFPDGPSFDFILTLKSLFSFYDLDTLDTFMSIQKTEKYYICIVTTEDGSQMVYFDVNTLYMTKISIEDQMEYSFAYDNSFDIDDYRVEKESFTQEQIKTITDGMKFELEIFYLNSSKMVDKKYTYSQEKDELYDVDLNVLNLKHGLCFDIDSYSNEIYYNYYGTIIKTFTVKVDSFNYTYTILYDKDLCAEYGWVVITDAKGNFIEDISINYYYKY